MEKDLVDNSWKIEIDFGKLAFVIDLERILGIVRAVNCFLFLVGFSNRLIEVMRLLIVRSTARVDN